MQRTYIDLNVVADVELIRMRESSLQGMRAIRQGAPTSAQHQVRRRECMSRHVDTHQLDKLRGELQTCLLLSPQELISQLDSVHFQQSHSVEILSLHLLTQLNARQCHLQQYQPVSDINAQ